MKKILFSLISIMLFFIGCGGGLLTGDGTSNAVLHYDGNPVGSYAVNIGNQAGVKFTPTDYNGKKLVMVDYYIASSTSPNLILRVYSEGGNDDETGNLLYQTSGSITPFIGWNSIMLSTPLFLSADSDIWVAFEVTSGIINFGLDNIWQVDLRNFYHTGGGPLPLNTQWDEIPSFNLNIRAIISN